MFVTIIWMSVKYYKIYLLTKLYTTYHEKCVFIKQISLLKTATLLHISHVTFSFEISADKLLEFS